MDDRHVNRVERDGRPESLPSIIVSQGEFSPMLKTLTFSLSLAVALGLCSMSKAGGLDENCTTCGLASPQGGVYPTGQGGAGYGGGCDTGCAPKKHCFSFHLPKICLPKISCPKLVHSTSYEWVLKKKHSFSLVHAPKETCGDPGYGGGAVYPTGQGGVSPSGQGVVAPTGQGAPYAAPQVFGAGQHAFQPARPATIASVTEMTPAVRGGEEAPPAPAVNEASAIGAPTGGLLLPTPSGN
jgi:hypothetical protein